MQREKSAKQNFLVYLENLVALLKLNLSKPKIISNQSKQLNNYAQKNLKLIHLFIFYFFLFQHNLADYIINISMLNVYVHIFMK